MLEFIRRNKVFTACLTFCICIILGLSTKIVIRELKVDENILVLPPIFNPVEEEKDPEITLFKGEYKEENNTVFLTWDYQLNSHSFQKVDLYRNEILIGTYYDDRQCDVSIFDYEMSTGYNDFEVILYYDNGMAVTKEASVFVDYVFDIETTHQLVDNNLGKGYFVTMAYTYNTKTPAGFPDLDVETTYATDGHGYWNWNQIGSNRQSLENDYQRLEVYYFISFDHIVDSEVSWEFDFKFNSVGVRKDMTFTENPSLQTIHTTDIEIKK